jgi:stage V sporulation protein K
LLHNIIIIREYGVKCVEERLDYLLKLLKTGKVSCSDVLKGTSENDSPPPLNIKNSKQQETIEDIMKELDSLIGLENVKRLVKEIQAFVTIQKKRKEENLNTDPLVFHMIFKGNPGTGKTTVARILGKILNRIGILEKGHLIEVERADLVGEYIGHTAQKVREQIKRAMGGILFIDEAYSLARGGEKDFGKEAIDTIVKSMEDYKDNLILILAGYKDEMDCFISTNPVLKSRFPIIIDFQDYGINELVKISEIMVGNRQYKLSSDAKKKIISILENRIQNDDYIMGNARFVRNIVETAMRKQAVRLVIKNNISRDDLLTLRGEDIIDEGLSSKALYSNR